MTPTATRPSNFIRSQRTIGASATFIFDCWTAKSPSICGLKLPLLLNYDDNLLIIEMTTVTPPYLLDFASAWLDSPPDFSREVINDWHDRLRESFGPLFPDIIH